MAKRLIYLLGAGASFHTIPILKKAKKPNGEDYPGFSNDLFETSEMLRKLTGDHLDDSFLAEADLLKDLSINSDKFGTIDTYLKFLRDTNRGALAEAKYGLNLFLFLKQYSVSEAKYKVDPRYIPWVTTLMGSTGEFPNDLVILSWNYDIQIPLALRETYGEEKLYSLDSRDHYHFPLNGLGGARQIPDGEMNYVFQFIRDLKPVKALTHFRNEFKSRSNSLRFAWELKDGFADYYKKAIEALKEAEILVIIGYSFPYFNRKVDDLILKSFLAGPNKKIYIQDPVLSESDLIGKFSLKSWEEKMEEGLANAAQINLAQKRKSSLSIEVVRNVDNFLIPHEY